MPCRNRKASRRLLLPEAFVPTSSVSFPKGSVVFWKFLKLVSWSDWIMAHPPRMPGRLLVFLLRARGADLIAQAFQHGSCQRSSAPGSDAAGGPSVKLVL